MEELKPLVFKFLLLDVTFELLKFISFASDFMEQKDIVLHTTKILFVTLYLDCLSDFQHLCTWNKQKVDFRANWKCFSLCRKTFIDLSCHIFFYIINMHDMKMSKTNARSCYWTSVCLGLLWNFYFLFVFLDLQCYPKGSYKI